MTITATMYGVYCRVSGGVTGTREAWLKDAGRLKIFPDHESASQEASQLNARMNHQHAKALFHYEARPLPEIIDVIAKQILEKWPA